MLEYDKLKSLKTFVYNDLYKVYDQDKDISPDDLKISIQTLKISLQKDVQI